MVKKREGAKRVVIAPDMTDNGTKGRGSKERRRNSRS